MINPWIEFLCDIRMEHCELERLLHEEILDRGVKIATTEIPLDWKPPIKLLNKIKNEYNG